MSNSSLTTTTLTFKNGGTVHNTVTSGGSGVLNFNGSILKNVADPADNTDVSNKQYIDDLLNNLSWKESCVAATTGTINTSVDLQVGDSIDGVTLAAGDRVLAKGQPDPTLNKIYIVRAGLNAIPDLDSISSDQLHGANVYVKGGTVNGDTIFSATSDSGNNITWTALSAGGGGVPSSGPNDSILHFDGTGNAVTSSANATIDSAGTLTCVQLVTTSDERKKTNVESLSSTETFNKLKPVKFDWKSTGTSSHGLIAQEVQKLYPECVKEDKEGMLSVDYIQIIALLIAEVQSLKQSVQ